MTNKSKIFKYYYKKIHVNKHKIQSYIHAYAQQLYNIYLTMATYEVSIKTTRIFIKFKLI